MHHELDQELRKLGAIAEDCGDVLWVCDLRLQHTYVSPSIKHFQGYTQEEFLVLPVTRSLTPDSLEKAALFLRTALEELARDPQISLKKVYLLEQKYLHKDGRVIWGEVKSMFLTDEKGAVIGIQGVTRDITERKLLEQRLCDAEKQEAVATLARGLAHDFRNIIGTILGNAEVLLTRVPPGDACENSLEQLLKATYRAKGLINRMFRIGSPAGSEKRPIDLARFTADALGIVRGALPAHIRLEESYPSLPTPVLADPSQLQQVIVNLFDNAVRAITPGTPGTVSVAIERKNYAGLGGELVTLSIRDTGCGIDPQQLGRIFDPYVTLRRSGTGLGLAIVDGIVRDHDGFVTVESTPGAGSLFSVHLPLTGEIAVPAPQERSGLRLLLVDDDADELREMKKGLETAGHQVTAVASPFEALELFQARPEEFDALLTDHLMPLMSGIQLAMEALSLRAELPVILLTASDGALPIERSAALGIREVLQKPPQAAAVKAAIARTLAAHWDGGPR